MRIAACVGGLAIMVALVGCRGGASAQPTSGAIDTRTGQPWHCVPDAQRTGWICERGDDFPPLPARAVETPVVASSAEPPSVAPVVTLLQQPANDQMSSHSPDLDERTDRYLAIDLRDVPRNHFVVQLTAMIERRELDALIDALNVEGLSSARVENDGRVFYVLLYGNYAERADAEKAARDRPLALREYEPWIRSVGSLQDAMLRADALPDQGTGGT